MDVRDYLERIEAHEAGPTLENLRHLHRQHLLTTPFENLDVRGRVPIQLDLEAILAKVVNRRRGGFCYELNSAFAWLLRETGYDVTTLSAEVAREDGSWGIPFDHMALRVDVGGEAFLADVGFGESFSDPLPLVPDSPVDEADFTFRLVRDAEHWILERGPEPFARQYRFTLTPRELRDFEPGCNYHQTSPDSHFTQKIVVSRALPEGRITLTSDKVIRRLSGVRTEHDVRDARAWERALEQHFGIQMERRALCQNDS